ncbi:MAG: hypothetical protein ACK5RI_10085 [Bacteroidota bacterium]|jgi:hypothetical protein|nr:hypothetical protein [Chitinophagaceae bacterium]MCA6497040.1 hypothetical protein [Chitinophagaceae bacterium]MCA6513511.1 hypothetical protein [Chitinophagaceae bacterium]MCA6513977.1 hypothetical protein [Chitinophagaceae bacterium]
MSKSIILRLVLIFCPLAVMAQETKIQLTEKVSIVFPEQPTSRNVQDINVQHTVKLADSTANFYALAINLEKSSGMTAEVLEAAQQESSFWEQLERSFVAQVSSDASVLSSELKQINERQVLHLLISGTRSGKKIEITAYIFIDGIFAVNVVHQKRDEGASVELKNRFFKSLQLSK